MSSSTISTIPASGGASQNPEAPPDVEAQHQRVRRVAEVLARLWLSYCHIYYPVEAVISRDKYSFYEGSYFYDQDFPMWNIVRQASGATPTPAFRYDKDLINGAALYNTCVSSNWMLYSVLKQQLHSEISFPFDSELLKTLYTNHSCCALGIGLGSLMWRTAYINPKRVYFDEGDHDEQTPIQFAHDFLEVKFEEPDTPPLVVDFSSRQFGIPSCVYTLDEYCKQFVDLKKNEIRTRNLDIELAESPESIKDRQMRQYIQGLTTEEIEELAEAMEKDEGFQFPWKAASMLEKEIEQLVKFTVPLWHQFCEAVDAIKPMSTPRLLAPKPEWPDDRQRIPIFMVGDEQEDIEPSTDAGVLYGGAVYNTCSTACLALFQRLHKELNRKYHIRVLRY
ncbi:hypothetical protein BU24DRAFT_458924 [Aaosphaeria arxii CBS 175.79]|uniref:Uncharacterized protein n=1 Tax=Aaosphaeria arxii CBS 175.79 TaxID=1450172 RepID=A0A6A5Y3X4_9PLEO|nr:uncharacterized protein BU24DRAFT_458924 [Aaosphaeria arxii CBS 175.79]KAF2019224.1 hypothetical protein BU24DRAFT_458924 [Aaosphaeria arxii CBS 175.79]